jgi:hypothetical protein
VTHREQQLEKALRDLLMEPGLYTQQAARRVLGLCLVCNRDRNDPCGLCADGMREDFDDR